MRTLCLVLGLIVCATFAGPSSGAVHEPPEPVPSFAPVPVDGRASVGDRDDASESARWTQRDVQRAHDADLYPLPLWPRGPHLVTVSRSTGGSGSQARVRGIASRMGPGFGPSYLALPEGPGHRVRICAKRCWAMTSTDAGPSLSMQRDGRVCDLNDDRWAYITGLPLSRGLGWVTVTYL